MTALKITPELAISAILLIISFMAFVITYNKAIRNRVDKSDLKSLEIACDRKNEETRDYIEQKDKAINARIDRFENRVEKKIDILLEHAISKKE